MDGVEVLPKPVVFLDQNRNWPLCRTAKCKKNGTLAVYCEPEGILNERKFTKLFLSTTSSILIQLASQLTVIWGW